MFSKKATEIDEIFTVDLTLKISSIFVAFLENMNFNCFIELMYILKKFILCRQITRIEAMKYAREAYNLGIRYIGGCCGFEPYHIRAMAEELRTERGRLPAASSKSEFARNLFMLQRRAEANPKVYANK